MERKLSVTKANEHCSCNSCHAKNYISDERFDTKVDVIYEVRIGMMCNRLCPDCLETLIGDAMEILGHPRMEFISLSRVAEILEASGEK